MKKDIENRVDIELLIKSFYQKVLQDETIAFFFTNIVAVNWEAHLPVMYDFWENVVFNTGSYTGNPMAVHMRLNSNAPLNKEHFARWMMLFTQTVDELFEGSNAILVKQRALSIATMMQVKMHSTT